MLKCWEMDPKVRPSFTELVKNTCDLIEENTDVVSTIVKLKGGGALRPVFGTRGSLVKKSKKLLNYLL